MDGGASGAGRRSRRTGWVGNRSSPCWAIVEAQRAWTEEKERRKTKEMDSARRARGLEVNDVGIKDGYVELKDVG